MLQKCVIIFIHLYSYEIMKKIPEFENITFYTYMYYYPQTTTIRIPKLQLSSKTHELNIIIVWSFIFKIDIYRINILYNFPFQMIYFFVLLIEIYKILIEHRSYINMSEYLRHRPETENVETSISSNNSIHVFTTSTEQRRFKDTRANIKGNIGMLCDNPLNSLFTQKT